MGSPSSEPVAKLIVQLDLSCTTDRRRLDRMQISAEALAALRLCTADGDLEFLRRRLEQMIEDERTQMQAFGLTPPEDRIPRKPAIDHPDDVDGLDGDDLG